MIRISFIPESSSLESDNKSSVLYNGMSCFETSFLIGLRVPEPPASTIHFMIALLWSYLYKY